MSNQILRREFLKSGLAGAVVVGFAPLNRSWITPTSARIGVELPPLDGALLTDPASLAAAASDFGHVVSRQPVAVLKSSSVDDIIRMTRFAREHRLKIGARPRAHSLRSVPGRSRHCRRDERAQCAPSRH
jgi:cytokinin dehydrogenase